MKLRPYQEEGVEFLVRRESAGLFYDTGIGKTPTVIKTIEALGLRERVLYVSPASTKFEVEKEFSAWYPGLKTTVIYGPPGDRLEQWSNSEGVMIVNYELLLKDIAIAPKEWEMIIADEGHRLSNYKAKTTKMFHKILKAPRRILMTATPILTKPEQIWGLVEWIKPGHLGNFFQFRYRYCILNHFGAVVGYRDLDELNTRIAGLYIRKNKRDVVDDLPPLTIVDIPVELSDNERRLYEIVKKELLFELQKNDLSVSLASLGSSVTNLTRLRQIAGSLELVSDIHKDSSKVEALKQKLSEIIEGSDEKVVIYSQYAKFIDIIARELAEHRPLVIQGSVSASDRSDAVELFQDDPTRRVMLISVAGGQGLNLQVASNLIMMDLSFSMGQNIQIMGRIERIGQTRPMFVYNLTARKTVDEYVARKLAKRKDSVEEVLGDNEDYKNLNVGEVIEAIK